MSVYHENLRRRMVAEGVLPAAIDAGGRITIGDFDAWAAAPEDGGCWTRHGLRVLVAVHRVPESRLRCACLSVPEVQLLEHGAAVVSAIVAAVCKWWS